MWKWLIDLLKGLFGVGIDKAVDYVEEDKLRAEASEAEAAKKQLASSAEVEQQQQDLQKTVEETKPVKSRTQVDDFIRGYNNPPGT